FFHAPPEEQILATSHVKIVRAFLGRGLLNDLEENLLFRSTLKLWFAHDVSLKGLCRLRPGTRWTTPGRKRHGAITAGRTFCCPVPPANELPSTACRRTSCRRAR